MSLLKISNKALRKLGVKEINSLTQQGKAAARCSAAVEDVVREVLSEHPWSHATVWAALPQLSTTPDFGYEYAYQLPNECVHLFRVQESEDLAAKRIDHTIVRGNVVYTDADPCYALYVVYYEADLTKASALFLDACAYKLGAEIASPLSKIEATQIMLNGYLHALDRARLRDAAAKHERKIDENRNCSILVAREYPSSASEDEET